MSGFGAEIAELALPLLALLSLSASASEVGFLRVAQFLPFLLATLPIGVLVDRRPRRLLALMVGADAGRFVLIAVVPIAVWTGVAGMGLLYAIVFAAGTLSVLFQHADFALLPGLVRADQLVDANGKIAAAASVNEIGGRGLGGLLVQAISAPVAMAVNAVAFLLSAASLSRIRRAVEPDVVPGKNRNSGADVREGLRVAWRNRYIRGLLGEATTFNLFNEIFVLGLMLYLVRGLHLGAGAVGLVFAAGGVGSFVGAWFGPRVTGRFGYGRVLLVTMAVGNTAPLAVSVITRPGVPVLPVLCAIFVTMGVGIGVANVHAVSLRQTGLREDLRGRVNAAYRLISWGAVPIGAGCGGLLAAHAGAPTAMLVGAGGMVAATLWVAGSGIPALRGIHDPRVRAQLGGS